MAKHVKASGSIWPGMSSAPVVKHVGRFFCVCTPFLHRAWFLIQASHFSNMQEGRGDLQSSAHGSSLQASQEARIDHPRISALNQFELLISVPVHSCTAFPFTQFRVLLIRHFCDLNSDFEEHPLRNQLQVSKPVQCVYVTPAYVVRGGSIPLCCRGSVQAGQVRDPAQARIANTAERHKQGLVQVKTTLEGNIKLGRATATNSQRRGGKFVWAHTDLTH